MPNYSFVPQDRTWQQPTRQAATSTNPYDQINPVTGRSYSSQFSGATSGSAWNPAGYQSPTSFNPNRFRPKPKNEAQERARANVYSGSDFSQYQNQLNDLINKPLDMRQSSGYDFAVNQGNQAIQRQAAAAGTSGSGNVLAELAKYGQGMASQEYDRSYERAMAERQNKLRTLADLMRGSQQFGLETGYYKPRRENLPFGTVDTSPSWY